MMKKRISSLSHDRRGVATLELALALPVLAFLLIAAIDYSLAIYTKFQLRAGAQAGAEYSAINGYDSAAIASTVNRTTSLANITVSSSKTCGCVSGSVVVANSCSASCSNGAALGTYVNVTTQLTHHTLLPYPGIPNQYDLTAQSQVRIP